MGASVQSATDECAACTKADAVSEIHLRIIHRNVPMLPGPVPGILSCCILALIGLARGTCKEKIQKIESGSGGNGSGSPT